MKEIIDITKVVIETGSLFANCDGNYDPREEECITRFLNDLEEKHFITTDSKNMLSNIDKNQISFETVCTHTQEFLKEFNEMEQKYIIKEILDFIETIIKADGKIVEQEEVLYNKWKETFIK